jgi:uncharacterized protein
LLLSFIVIASISSAFAQEIKIPERPDPPRLVNDFAGMISGGDAEAIERKLDAYNDSTSTQIAIVTIPTLGGAEINQFATELFHKWGIGQKGKDNGVLLFIAKDDHQLFIVTGRGVEEFLPDAICKRIIEETIKPQFKAGNYAGGINAGIDEMMARLSGQFKGDPNANTDNAPPIKFNIKWIFIIIIIIFVLVSIFGGGSGGNTYSSGGSSGLWFLLGMLSGGGGRGGGWGGGDSGGGGGFGGFGGGDSGGGGAGGSW